MGGVVPIRGRKHKVMISTQDEALKATRVDLHGIALIAGVSLAGVKSWRNKYLVELDKAQAEGREPVFDDNCLLAPDEELTQGGSWAPKRVVQWLRDTERMALDSYQPRSRKSGGNTKARQQRAA